MTGETLAGWAGIPIGWNAAGDELVFGPRLTVSETKTRRRGDLRPVLPDDAACAPPDAVQYWMYNGISLPEHAAVFDRHGFQYELTLLYPVRLGAERSKTLGHIHTFPPGSRLNYPEVCEVLWGEALFVFQALDADSHTASLCFAVHARQGDKVVFPPNLHHLTINPGDEALIFSDVISTAARGSYDGLSSMGGAAYLYGDAAWTLNPRYAGAAPLAVYAARDYPQVGLRRDVPLYTLAAREPDRLAWLNEPGLFHGIFPELAAFVP